MSAGSLVLLWAAPLYQGQSPVTGYFLEISEGDQSDNWTTLNEKQITDTHYKVSEARGKRDLAHTAVFFQLNVFYKNIDHYQHK